MELKDKINSAVVILLLSQVAEIRNHLSHMALDDNMQLDSQTVTQYFQDIKAFVTCLENLQHFAKGIIIHEIQKVN